MTFIEAADAVEPYRTADGRSRFTEFWRDRATGTFNTFAIGGSHRSIMDPPDVVELASRVEQAL